MKRAYFRRLFLSLVSASLTSGFRLLLFSYGRFFVKFLLSKIADNTVAGAFSLKTTKRAFHVLVLSNSYRRHTFSPSFADAFILVLCYYNNFNRSCQVFFRRFLQFFINFSKQNTIIPENKVEPCRKSNFSSLRRTKLPIHMRKIVKPARVRDFRLTYFSLG